MLFFRLPCAVLLPVLSLLTYNVYCGPLRNPHYTVELGVNDYMDVFSPGYEDGEEAVDEIRVNHLEYKVQILVCNNGLDKLESRMHLNEVIEDMWELLGGGRTQPIRVIEFRDIANIPTKQAIASARSLLRLPSLAQFSVRRSDPDPTIWNLLASSPLTKAVNRVAANAGTSITSVDIIDTVAMDGMRFTLRPN